MTRPTDDELLEYVTGRLGTADAQPIEDRARSDRDLANRIEVIRNVMAARHDDPGRPAAGEFGWARLSRAIDQVGLQERPAAKAPQRPRIWQMAAAAVVAVAAWQVTVVPSLTKDGGETEAVYRTAGDTSAAPYSAKIAFRPSATEAQIRAALIDAQAEITAGPGALGLYQLKFADADHLQRGIASLGGRKDIVESIERN